MPGMPFDPIMRMLFVVRLSMSDNPCLTACTVPQTPLTLVTRSDHGWSFCQGVTIQCASGTFAATTQADNGRWKSVIKQPKRGSHRKLVRMDWEDFERLVQPGILKIAAGKAAAEAA